MSLISAFDLLGAFVFAISGALAGIERRLDLFGVLFTAFITAVGGGTMRDVLLGAYPIGWIRNTNYLLAIALGYCVTLLLTQQMQRLRNALFLFDTIGIGVVTLIGVQKALLYKVDPLVAVLMGMVSSVFGGVLRDTFTNEIPLIFRKEVYAVACLLGGAWYLTLRYFGVDPIYNQISTVSVVITIRLLAVHFELSLPIHLFVDEADTIDEDKNEQPE